MMETRWCTAPYAATKAVDSLRVAVCESELLQKALQEMEGAAEDSGEVIGTFIARICDDVLHVTGFASVHRVPETEMVGAELQCPLLAANGPPDNLSRPGWLWATCDPLHPEEIHFWVFDPDGDQTIGLNLISFSASGDLYTRVDAIFETQVLQDKLVTVIGLGSGGSLVSVELARCGVRRFCLIDFDRLEPHNIPRHACAVSDIGRLKTRAVKDRLLDINPLAEVETHEFDIMSESEEKRLRQLIRSSDLVLACTDAERTKYRINLLCLQEGVTAIYAGAYERAFGGDVLRVDPGPDRPCYDCVIGAVQRSFDDKPRGPIPYSRIENIEEFKAEPGLGLDVHFIVLIEAKMALLTLLRGTDSELEDLEHDFVLWGNRKEWIFSHPFDCRMAVIQVRDDCPTHQLVFQDRDELAQATAEKDRILATIKRNDRVVKGGLGRSVQSNDG